MVTQETLVSTKDIVHNKICFRFSMFTCKNIGVHEIVHVMIDKNAVGSDQNKKFITTSQCQCSGSKMAAQEYTMIHGF